MDESDSDNEIGRGRPMRRSSSVESSPRQGRARSISPISDVGDPIVPGENASKDLTSTKNRPLIREAVAFSWDSSKSLAPVQAPIDTYEAQLPKLASSRKPRFLPGQAVPTQPRAKRAKRNQEFSAQTGRFRLGDASTANAGLGELAQQALASVLNPTNGAPPPTRRRGRKPAASKSNTSQVMAGDELLAHSHIGSSSNYYRRDYDLDFATPLSSASIDQQILSLQSNGLGMIGGQYGRVAIDTAHTSAHPHQPHINSQRLITLLITDLRSPAPDRQLAEVKVPLTPAENPDDGFRVDARDVCDQLQTSPSRIDGPAKVYALRGEFRQFFLRVSEMNLDDYGSANLYVSQKLSLEVFVEAMAPQYLPSGSGSQSVDPFNDYATNSPAGMRKRHRSPASDRSSVASTSRRIAAWQSLRQRSRSPSAGASSTSSSLAPYKRLRTREDNPMSDKEHSDTSLILARGRARQFEIPEQEIGSEDIHQQIIRTIETSAERDPDWMDFAATRLLGSLRVQDLIIQYRFVSRIVAAWEGRLVPCGFQQYYIRKHHILKAFSIEDDQFLARCEETLKLVGMFGPGGKIRAEPMIVDMMEEIDDPPPDQDIAIAFLEQLRSVHRTWKQSLPPIPRIIDR
ncbi:hypothetical protein BDN72DRAFT_118510 [Pluteus cervinus]|uniref:Uncharacterized protein n=1 Tax=Pluteus cervinus TaxID=181527 RepID=A0ACD3B8F7_9AGAR|nr:hypothetical protein BDN72DRAFT_118510 [Pluteus cervinus]